MKANELRRREIQLEMNRTLYQQFPVIMFLAPTGAILLILFQSEFISPTVWLPWLISILIINGLGSGLMFTLYKKYGSQPENADQLHRLLIIYTTIIGSIWGAVGILFLPVESREHQLLSFVWLWALAAMISASLVALVQVFHILLILILLPLAINSALYGDPFHLIMAAATTAFMFGLAFMYRSNNKTFLQAVSMRFQNAELIEQLQRKKLEAEQANLAKSKFLSAASHDLRQPVHAQGLYIAELDDYIDNPRGRMVLAGLENSVHALRQLLDSVLDIAKLDAGVVSLHKQDIPVESLFEEIRAVFAPQYMDQGIALRTTHTSAIVNSDRNLLAQILRNLVANALRYTLKGRVLIGCRQRDKHIRIEVWDTGIGISPEQTDSIFNEFYQVGNAERDREKGLGLGLAIVRRICELLEYRISVHSVPNKGSMFRVEVPVGLTAPSIDNSPSEQADLKGVSIVLIENELQVLNAMLGLLKHWGCHVLDAASAEVAIKKLVDWPHQPEVIVTDYRLHGRETGITAIEQIRNMLSIELPAIIITGDTAPERIQEAFRNGHPVLHKPVSSDLLRANIAQACGR